MGYPRRTIFLRGKLSYAKILGDPVLNYSKDGKEWTLDLELDKEGEKQAKAEGLNIRKKDNYLDGKPYVTIKQRELRSTGEPNKAPTVKDEAGTTWPVDTKLGNGTKADVKASIVDYGVGKKQGVYLDSVRILQHEEYSATEFPPLSSDDEFFGKAAKAPANRAAKEDAQFKKDFLGETESDDLDDEIPFA